MKKIISLFQRNYDGDRLVRNEVVPEAEWVLNGEGEATRKWDGTCCMIRDGQLFKRYEVKCGKNPPFNFEPAGDVDPVTGKQQGWLPVKELDPQDQWHRQAWEWRLSVSPTSLPDGTYELIGPKVQGGVESKATGLYQNTHVLLRHGGEKLPEAPRDFDGLKEYFKTANIEGIVWHHPDGRMVKIKAKDFGIKRPQANQGAESS